VQLNAAELRRAGEVFIRPQEEPFETEAQLFLEELAKPSLVFGGFELNTKLIPTFLWDRPLKDNIYHDDPEEVNRPDGRLIRLDWTDARLPEHLLAQLVHEMDVEITKYEDAGAQSDLTKKQYDNIKDTLKRITEGRSNPYPRPIAMPEIIDSDYGRLFRIRLGEGKFGVALVEERKLALNAALEARTKHILHSLALRVAYLYKENPTDNIYMAALQQRKPGPNSSWPLAWDCGGAGYFDPANHVDEQDPPRISPCQGAADEIAKELAIPKFELSNRDSFHFFGLANDEPTGHINLIGYCVGGYKPDPNRPKTAYVHDYARCRFTPEDVANFILAKRRWVPAALLTLILTLEAAYEGKIHFTRDRIEEAFSRLAGQLDLSPE
jgi:hypothetical protein